MPVESSRYHRRTHRPRRVRFRNHPSTMPRSTFDWSQGGTLPSQSLELPMSIGVLLDEKDGPPGVKGLFLWEGVLRLVRR